MAFEKFTEIGGSFVPKISIRTNGQIGISQGALRKFKLDRGEWYVVLFYDPEEELIGILPTKDSKTDGAIQLIKREIKGSNGKSSWNTYIACKSFFDYYEIPTQETKSFIGEWNDEVKMIIIDTKTPV